MEDAVIDVVPLESDGAQELDFPADNPETDVMDHQEAVEVKSDFTVSADDLAAQFMSEDAGFVIVLLVIVFLGWVMSKFTKKTIDTKID